MNPPKKFFPVEKVREIVMKTANGLQCGVNNCLDGFPDGYDCSTSEKCNSYSDARCCSDDFPCGEEERRL